MSIHLHMRPDIPAMSWDEFRAQMPTRSIALDGFIKGPPAIDVTGLYFNFDHHDGPPRASMHCTAVQVLEAVRTGLMNLLMPTGDEEVHVWMRDNDPDVALAVYAIEKHWFVCARVNPAIHRLYGHIEDMDCSSGLCDVPRDMPIVGQSAWIFQPYWQYRMSGIIDRKDPSAHLGVLRDVIHRVNEFVVGRGNQIPIDDRYEKLSGGDDWVMIREIGPHARMKMARRGVKAFVSARERSDGRWVYTLCRESAYIYWFPIPEIGAFLNQEEEASNHFGGGDIVYGNAYGNASARSPEELSRAINGYLLEHRLCAP